MTVRELVLPILSASVGASAEKYLALLEARYGTVDGFAEAEAEEMIGLGIPPQVALTLRLVTEIAGRRVTENYPLGEVYSEAEIRELLRALLFGRGREYIYLLIMDRGGRLLGIEKMSGGTANVTNFAPRIYIDRAARLGGEKMILAHNHPGGEPVPSRDDISATQQLSEVLKGVGMELVAHYIVAGGMVLPVGFHASDMETMVDEDFYKNG